MSRRRKHSAASHSSHSGVAITVPASVDPLDEDEAADALTGELEPDAAEPDEPAPVELLNDDEGDRRGDVRGDHVGDDVGDDVGEAAAHQIAFLSSLLQEKEDLVGALTSRLEEAAEQLDRFQRTGGHRGGGGGGGGLPSELVEQQRRLAEQLSSAVEAWESAQPTTSLERILSELGDVRRLLSTSASPVFASPEASRAGSQPSSSAPVSAPTDDSWAAVKERLLAESGVEPPEPQSEPSKQAPAAIRAPETSTPEERPSVEPIDVDAADRESLQKAVVDRDAYIAYLIRRLRSLESAQHDKIDWTALNNAPDELRNRLQELERRLQEQLSREELELSLERARLSREHAQLQAAQRRAEMLLRQSGPAQPASDDLKSAENTRWSRIFGR